MYSTAACRICRCGMRHEMLASLFMILATYIFRNFFAVHGTVGTFMQC